MPDPGLVVVVGVGSGLGGAIAKRFATGGYAVAMATRTTKVTDAIASEIEAAGGTAKGFTTDAQDEASMRQLFDDAEAAFGPVGVAVFNVGDRELKAFLEIDAAELEKTWRLNCLSAFLMAKEAAARMAPRGEGSIFFTGTPSSRRGQANHAAFVVAKFGVYGMAQTMARELSPKGIHVAHFAVDGGVANAHRLNINPELAANDGLMSLEALAEAYYQTHLQPRNCWAFDVEMRPWNRTF